MESKSAFELASLIFLRKVVGLLGVSGGVASVASLLVSVSAFSFEGVENLDSIVEGLRNEFGVGNLSLIGVVGRKKG